MTFEEFTQSTDIPYNLAVLFLTYYEQPRYQERSKDERGEQAEYWYEYLK